MKIEVKSIKGLYRIFNSKYVTNHTYFFMYPLKVDPNDYHIYFDIAAVQYIDNNVVICSMYHDTFMKRIEKSYEYKIPIIIQCGLSKNNSIIFTIKYDKDKAIVRRGTKRMVYNKFERNQINLYKIWKII